MSSDNVAIKVRDISKCYQIYGTPRDRLKQFVVPRLQRLSGRRNVSQYFREFWALKGVSLDIMKGETVGIIGRNGSGKSTLLQLICGTVTPTSGTVETKGRIAALLELGSGFNPEFTGRENVYMNATLLGLSPEEITARFDDIVGFADIGDFIDQPVRTYSSGMFVRLAFAIQASVDPEILIVDEALAVGDAQFVHRCMLRFHELQQKGTTILFVSHDASSVKRLCSRAIWLKNGEQMSCGGATVVVDAYLQDLFALKPTQEDAGLSVGPKKVTEAASYQDLELEVPSGDGCYGEGGLEITGAQLSNKMGLKVATFGWNEAVCLMLEIKNNNVPCGQRIACGYIVRDHKGIEIASTSTLFESVDIYAPALHSFLRVSVEFTLPMLHPGHYSLTPSVSAIPDSGEPIIHNRILNAFVFEITTDQRIVSQMRFPTLFSILKSA